MAEQAMIAELRALVREAYFAGWSDCCEQEGAAYYPDDVNDAWGDSDIMRALRTLTKGDTDHDDR